MAGRVGDMVSNNLGEVNGLQELLAHTRIPGAVEKLERMEADLERHRRSVAAQRTEIAFFMRG